MSNNELFVLDFFEYFGVGTIPVMTEFYNSSFERAIVTSHELNLLYDSYSVIVKLTVSKNVHVENIIQSGLILSEIVEVLKSRYRFIEYKLNNLLMCRESELPECSVKAFRFLFYVYEQVKKISSPQYNDLGKEINFDKPFKLNAQTKKDRTNIGNYGNRIRQYGETTPFAFTGVQIQAINSKYDFDKRHNDLKQKFKACDVQNLEHKELENIMNEFKQLFEKYETESIFLNEPEINDFVSYFSNNISQDLNSFSSYLEMINGAKEDGFDDDVEMYQSELVQLLKENDLYEQLRILITG